MKKFIIAFAAICLALSSCEEFQPVFTVKYPDSVPERFYTDEEAMNIFGVSEFTSVKEIKQQYKRGKSVIDSETGSLPDDCPNLLDGSQVLRVQVVSTDESGNVYREIYVQDNTGGIDFKIGRSSSYDDYKVGQILYICCDGFVVGEYGYKSGSYGGAGIIQIGMPRNSYYDADEDVYAQDDYETAYIDLMPILNKNVLKGKIFDYGDRIQPYVPKGSDLTSNSFKNDIYNILEGRLVTLKDMKYENSTGGKEAFCLFYPNPGLDHANTATGKQNRVFLSSPLNGKDPKGDYTFGITTWALTKTRFIEKVESGIWDDMAPGDDIGTIATRKTDPAIFGVEWLYKDVILAHPSAQSVSQYFTYDGAEVQVRSSGYSRFADIEIPESVRNGSDRIDVLAIMSRYQGKPQLTLLDAWLSSDTSHSKSILDPKNVKK